MRRVEHAGERVGHARLVKHRPERVESDRGLCVVPHADKHVQWQVERRLVFVQWDNPYDVGMTGLIGFSL